MTEGELRGMVREVLREALAERGQASGGAPRPPSSAPAPNGRPVDPALSAARTQPRRGGAAAPGRAGQQTTETVRIADDAELAAFVRRLAALMADPATAAALRDGRHRFTLAAAPSRPAAASAATPARAAPQPAGHAVLTGTITEAKISRLDKGATVAVAPGAVMTPLARDRARAMGITIERRR